LHHFDAALTNSKESELPSGFKLRKDGRRKRSLEVRKRVKF